MQDLHSTLEQIESPATPTPPKPTKEVGKDTTNEETAAEQACWHPVYLFFSNHFRGKEDPPMNFTQIVQSILMSGAATLWPSRYARARTRPTPQCAAPAWPPSSCRRSPGSPSGGR